VRLPEHLLDEAADLVPLVQADPVLGNAVGTVTMVHVVRIALQRGLASLRADLAGRKA
jgi:hypothetical protein